MIRYKAILTLMVALVLPLNYVLSQIQAIQAPSETNQKTTISNLWGIGLKVGLNGVGVEVVKGISDQINVRLGYSVLAIPITSAQKLEGYNLQVDAKVSLGGADLLVDYYPIKSLFHLTGGLLLNNTLVGFDVKSLSSFPYGDISIPAEDVGTISGQLGPGNKLSPYVAIGFGNTLSRQHPFSFNVELGTFYQGSPIIALTGQGVIGPMASENNTIVINKAISQYSWFPMLNFLVTYRIF